jgi:hypothetical protein
MEESLPYGSERMPPRPTRRVPNYDTVSEGEGKGGGGKVIFQVRWIKAIGIPRRKESFFVIFQGIGVF